MAAIVYDQLLDYEEKLLKETSAALRSGVPPEDFYIPPPPPAWEEVPPLTSQPNWDEIENEDALRRLKRLRSCTPKVQPVTRRRVSEFSKLHARILASGGSRRQFEQEAQKLSKFNRAQARAYWAYKKALRAWNSLQDFADSNPFVLPGKIEAAVQLECDSRRTPKCNVRPYRPPRRTGFVPKSDPVREMRRERLFAYIEKKRASLRNQAPFFWRVRRADRRQRMHEVVRFVNHRRVATDLKPCQRDAIIQGWWDKKDILCPSFCLTSCRHVMKIPSIGEFHCHQMQDYLSSLDSEKVYPQMDEGAHGEESVTQFLQAGDVVQQDSRSVSIAAPFPRGGDTYAALSSNLKPSNHDDRWFTIFNVAWSKANGVGAQIAKLSLPNFLIANFPESPNAMLFKQHVYWRGTMCIRVVANCNMRQYGQLQCRFYYGANEERDFEALKGNIYVGSQQPHCLITANQSNVGELEIPFEYIRPLLYVANDVNQGFDNATIGNLYIYVIVPLTMASGTQTSCNVSVQIDFKDSSFVGQVYRDFVGQGPISDSLKESANSLIDNFNFLNLDKPTDVQKGSVILPQNTGPWSSGTDISEWSVPLRLSLSKTMPYAPGRIPSIDEMSVKHVSSIFGLFKILNWRANMRAGTLLYTQEATPTWKFEDYPQVEYHGVSCSVLPPVSVLTNLFTYWRGSLKLRIDVVGGVELTGRLLVSYIPRCNDSNPPISKVYSCPHAIFDLQENRQFVFEIPYLADRMFWPKHDTIDWVQKSYVQPGRFYIYVYNDLIANNTIPSDCKLVLYLAAGDDFELSIPCAPSIGLGLNPNILIAENVQTWLSFKSGYHPVYAGSWHSFGGGQRYIMRYSAISDHVAQCEVSNWSDIVNKVLKPLNSFNCGFYRAGVRVDCSYFVACMQPKAGSLEPQYIYLLPFSNLTAAKACAIIAEESLDQVATKAEKFDTSGDWCVPSQMIFIPVSSTITHDRSNSSDVIYPQMDERSQCGIGLSPLGRPQTTGAGLAVVGESFTDLKDLARRFQRYARGNNVIDPTNFPSFDCVQLCFPAMPQGLDLDIGSVRSINEYWNRTRDGPIPIIASGYKFFTGGLRFRVVLKVRDEVGSVFPVRVFVQHRPGVASFVPTVQPVSHAHRGTADLELPGFAYHIQTTDINSIISIEVPYYLPSIRGYLQKPLTSYPDALTHSLGVVCIGINSPHLTKFNLEYDIYYSLADDSRFAVFQGFPPMIDNTKVPNLAEPSVIRSSRAAPVVVVPKEDIVKEEKESVEKKIPVPQWKTVLEDYLIYAGIPSDLANPDFVIHVMSKAGYALEDGEDGYKKMYEDLKKIFNEKDNSSERFKHMLFNLYQDFFVWKNLIKEGVNYTRESLYQEIRKIDKVLASNFWRAINVRVNHDRMASFEPKFPQGDDGLFSGISSFLSDTSTVVSNAAKVDVESINAATQNLSTAADNVSNVSQEFQAGIQAVKDFFGTDNGCQTDPEKADWKNYCDVILSMLINVSSIVLQPTVTSFVTAVLNVLMNMKLVSLASIMEIGTTMTNWLNSKLRSSNEPNEEVFVPNAEEDDTTLASYISTVVAGVAGVMNFSHSLCRDKKRALAKILLGDMKDFALTANHLFIFCKNNILMIKNAMDWLWGSQPALSHLSFFLSYDKEIFEWAKEVAVLLDGRNRELLSGNIVAASRVYECANQACLIQLKLMEVEKQTALPKEKLSVLNNLIKEILKLRDQLARQHIAPPIKFEPFVVHVFGEPGIGKSFISQVLPFKMLDSIGYRSYQEILYTRTAGNAYWSGLSHQPVVLFDDWYQIDTPEFGGIQIAELLQLKTRAVFNPPMAAVEDKGIRYNPLIVFLVSNQSHPKYTGVACPEALYRRVDYLVHARRKREYDGRAIEDIPIEVRDVYGHLEFCECPPLHPMGNYNAENHQGYGEFETAIVERFGAFYRSELRKYNVALRRMTSLYPRDGEQCFKLPQQEFWTKSEVYLSEVKLEDIEVNNRYAKILREYVTGKIRSLREVSLRFWNCLKPNAEDDTANVELDASDGFSTPRSDAEEVEFLVPDLKSGCIHTWLPTILEYGFDAVVWNNCMKAWEVQVDYNLLDVDFLNAVLERFGGVYGCERPWIVEYLDIMLPDDAAEEVDKSVEIFPFILSVDPMPGLRCFRWRKSGLVYDPQTDTIYIPHQQCSSRCCWEATSFQRFVHAYIDQDFNLHEKFKNGVDITGEVPEQFFLAQRGGTNLYEDASESVGWLKGFWDKTLKVLTTADRFWLYRWISRVVFFITLISPLWIAFDAARSWKKATVANVEEQAKIMEDFRQWKLARTTEPQGFASGDNIVRGGKLNAKQVAVKLVGQMGEVEFSSLRHLLWRNTFFLVIEKGQDEYLFSRFLGVFGHVALFPTHYRDAINENAKIYFLPATNPVAELIKFSELKFVDFDDSSLSAVILPKRIPLFKNIVKRTATSEMHSRANGLGAIVEIAKPKERAVGSEVNVHHLQYNLESKVKVYGTKLFKDFVVGESYNYKGFQGAGCCGSILVAENLPCGIIGMHVAGSDTKGVSEAITQEMLQSLYDFLGDSPDVYEPELGPVEKAKLTIPSTVQFLGTVSPMYAHRESEKSRIIPSLIQLEADKDEFPVYSDVAVLSPRDPRLPYRFSPMVEGCYFHGLPLVPFDKIDLQEIEEDLTNLYLAKNVPVRMRVGKLTKMQACAGIDGVPGYDALEWNTSEGFPLSSERPYGFHDKRWLFKFENNRCAGFDSRLLQLLRQDKVLRKANTMPFTCFVDCLKDCTVAKEKVLTPGKTRVFSIAPVQFTIVERQLTLDFCVGMMHNRLDLEHAVGINPDSVEWGELASSLLEVGDKIVTGDYSKFGDTIPIEFILMFFRIINAWYRKFTDDDIIKEEEFARIRTVIAHEVGHAVHLMFNLIYRVFCGQPSGNSLTVLLNSFANSVYIRLAWMKTMRGTAYAGLKAFKKFVRLFSYGDDVILSVADEVADVFNACALHDFFAEHGLKFTNADKSDTIVPFTDLSKADFLKRGFRLHPRESRAKLGLMLAPLGRESIEDTINWVWNSGYDLSDSRSPAFVQMCIQICQDASRNAWTRGPTYYREFTSKLRRFWSDRGEYVVFDSWDDLDAKIFDLHLDLKNYKGLESFEGKFN